MPVTLRDDELHRRSLESLLHPKSIAIVGASGTKTRMGGLIVELLKRHQFPGPVYPINPRYEEVGGFRCYPSLLAIPDDVTIDLVIIFIGAENVVEAVTQSAARGVKALVVLSSGFSEIGEAGEALQSDLVRVANQSHMAVAGPNCAGLANFREHFVAYGTTNFIDRVDLLDGSVAILTASGGLGNTVFTYCEERGIGVSFLIGLGNEAVTTAGDYLEALIDDLHVDVVLCNLEAVRDPVRFFKAAKRAIALGKPVVALKGGRSEVGKKAIVTHTAALGGSAEAFSSAFEQLGIVQVKDLDELADCAMLFSLKVPVVGTQLGVFSLPGGATSLLSDIANDFGFSVPDLDETTVSKLEDVLPPIAVIKNPLDPTAGFARDSEKFQRSLVTFANDPGIDVVIFFPLASQVDYAQQIANDVVAVRDQIDKPIVVIWTAGQELESGAWRTLRDSGVPLFHSTRATFLALNHARRYQEFLSKQDDPDFNDYGSKFDDLKNALDIKDAGAGRDILRSYGVFFPESLIVKSAAEAASAFNGFNAPVAMKVFSDDVPHKTEVGGVVLSVTSAESAASAFTDIMTDTRKHVSSADITGVEMQPMLNGGVEVILGISTDHQLGPILSVGIGGIFTELLRDVAQRPVPISRGEALEMLKQLRGSQILYGFRERPPVDTAALVDTMLGLSAFANAYRHLKPELDLNPVVVLPNNGGAFAIDCLLHLGEAP